MEHKELSDTVITMKWVFPIISIAFTSLVSLLIYIWKANVRDTNGILQKLVTIVDRLEKSEAVSEFRMSAMEKDIEKLQHDN